MAITLCLVALIVTSTSVFSEDLSSQLDPVDNSRIRRNASNSSQDLDNKNVRRNHDNPSLVDEIIRPGVSYTPRTGKHVHVYELSNKTFMGLFISHDGQIIRFVSTFSGLLHVYRDDGSNIIEHHFLSKKGGIHSAQIEGHSFVYGHGKTYLVENHRNRREAVEVFNSRRTRSDSSDDHEVERAVDELRADQDTRLLEQLAFALGDFGISGKNSPSARFFYMVARSVNDIIPNNKTVNDPTGISWDYHGSGTIEPNSDLSPTSDPTGFPRAQRSSDSSARSRRKRGWWGATAPPPTCEAYPNRDLNCRGMCGRLCDCWEFVCGDCCFHQGCYEHDLCCNHDFGSFACLFPFWMTCEWYHAYPGCLE